MIVKNESRIIERLLESVKSIVDSYCICDTGSTDDTAQRITEFMRNANIPGTVLHEPFQNFGYNRTFVLNAAAAWGDYALLLDADMVLHVEKAAFRKTALTDDGYMVLQKNGDLHYYNTRIVRLGIGVTCVGVTHEYYQFPPTATRTNTKLPAFVIEDIGDGGAKADKFERDIRLLTQGLAEEPTNARYMFYLANSYRDANQPAKAVEWYKRRIAAKEWQEEVFYAAYELGNMYKRLGDAAQAVYWWLDAYNMRPWRAESVYELVKYYRETGAHTLAQHFCDLGRTIQYPAGDILFVKRSVYEYLFDYEQSILAFYTRRPINHFTIQRLLGIATLRSNVLGNYKFYARSLQSIAIGHVDMSETVERSVGGRVDTFRSSTPCIVANGSGAEAAYTMNVRYVNYWIAPDGSYHFRHNDGKITSLNKCIQLDRNLKPLQTHWFDAVEREDLRYQGVEDVKLFVSGNKGSGDLVFVGTVQDPDSGALRLGYGSYAPTEPLLRPRPIASPRGRDCEKNWAMCRRSTDGAEFMVYEWGPLTLGTLRNATLQDLTTNAAVPPFFRDVRGSSHGIPVGADEVWFLCHIVHYGASPRHYYHLIVVLDSATLAYKKHSALFKFADARDPIEYGLGLAVEDARILFSYSRMDRTSELLCVDRARFETEFGWTSV